MMNRFGKSMAVLSCATTLFGCASRMAPIRMGPLDDQTIRIHVQTLLLNDPNVHAREVTVEVAQGVVTLRGAVHGEQEVNAAVAAARKADGVKDVKSELEPAQ